MTDSGINWAEQIDYVEEATKPITVGTHTFRIVSARIPATVTTAPFYDPEGEVLRS